MAVLMMAASLCACASRPELLREPETRVHALRLKPGDDVRVALESFARDHKLKAASIASAVGSLTDIHLRYANQPDGKKQKGHFEVLSLSGMVAESGVHAHISVGDDKGRVIGGHLLAGNTVYTTLEIILLEYTGLEFLREHDPATGYNELVVRTAK